jgi:hypothetical protein
VEVKEVLRRRTKASDEALSVEATPTSSAEMHKSIARRAYQLYEARGGAQGDPLVDWLTAEAEILGKMEPRANQALNGNGAATGSTKDPARSKPRKKAVGTVSRKIALRPRSLKEDNL